MCGIAGVRQPDERPVATTTLEAMAAALAHRGPDGDGTWQEGGLGLAATRLAVVGEGPAGDQPMVADGCALAFNGELYNRPDLLAELRGAGIEPVGRSDTEVLFHLLRLLGVGPVLPRLRGMFAFAWVDRDRTVHLARDRYGVKPLHWAQRGPTVAWASEVKGLVPAVEVRPDRARALFSVLSLADRWSERTVFDGVRQVRPGQRLEVAPDGTVRVETWHRLRDDVDPDLAAELAAAGPHEVHERLAAAVERAVTAMLMSDRSLATLTSGGVDSSLVAAVATAHDPDHALYAAAVSGPHNELDAAAALGRRLGRPVHAVPFTPEMVLEDWARCTWHHEAPIVTHLNALPLARVAGAVREHGTKAVLTGEGADELFGGYPAMAARPHLDLLRLPYRALRRLYGLVPGLAGQVLPGGPSQEGYLAALGDDFESVRLAREAGEVFDHLEPAEARDAAATYVALHGHLRTLLQRNDRMGMQHSVESRFPFLDEDVVAIGLNLPRRHKRAPTARPHDRKHPFLLDKAVLRRVAAQRGLPGARRRKDGFPSWGHVDMRVGAGLFRGGWVAELLELSEPAIDHLVADEDPYYVAKLASVEVFGRLFDRDAPIDQVTDDVARHVTMAPRADGWARGRPVASRR